MPGAGSHAVSRLRDERLARSVKPFRARGSRAERCPRCRLPGTHCLCALRPAVAARAGFCLLMHDVEPLRTSNTGWLVADLAPDTEAFAWSRTEADPRLLALLDDPRWQPCVIFPAQHAAPQRVIRELPRVPGRRPLFVLLDATWSKAHKMFHRSPYLDRFPVLALEPGSLSRYRLRHAARPAHLCTAEAAALCLRLAGEEHAARALDAWLDVFIAHSLDARLQRPLRLGTEAHERLAALAGPCPAPAAPGS